jgi:hypothetical protein
VIASRRELNNLLEDLNHRTSAWHAVRKEHYCWEAFFHDASVLWDKSGMVFLMSGTRVLAYDTVSNSVCPMLFHRNGMTLLAQRYLQRWNWRWWQFRLKAGVFRVLAHRALAD